MLPDPQTLLTSVFVVNTKVQRPEMQNANAVLFAGQWLKIFSASEDVPKVCMNEVSSSIPLSGSKRPATGESISAVDSGEHLCVS
jgi:hypothetical protein